MRAPSGPSGARNPRRGTVGGGEECITSRKLVAHLTPAAWNPWTDCANLSMLVTADGYVLEVDQTCDDRGEGWTVSFCRWPERPDDHRIAWDSDRGWAKLAAALWFSAHLARRP